LKLKEYLLSQLASTFFPIFLGLYFITSIIFLVRIAALTSVITMNVIELFQLYMYVMPSIIFYTLPISFFISLVLTLSKLSSEYELIVVTSFGLNPLKIIKIFLPVTLILSIALVFISVGLMPKAKYLNKRFLDQKKKEANFNIKASEFGQKFSDWLIYITDKKDKTYSNVKLFQTKENVDQFIIAKSAVLENDKGALSFKLNKGKFFNIKDEEFNQIDYNTLDINESLADKKKENFTTTYSYWIEKIKQGDKRDTFAFYILISIFPLLSLLLVIAFGYYNPRYEKNRSTMLSTVSVLVYYIIMQVAVEKIELHSIYLIPIFWLIVTYYIYRRNIKSQY
jgi:lipopolysaccharide export system permease protein